MLDRSCQFLPIRQGYVMNHCMRYRRILSICGRISLGLILSRAQCINRHASVQENAPGCRQFPLIVSLRSFNPETYASNWLIHELLCSTCNERKEGESLYTKHMWIQSKSAGLRKWNILAARAAFSQRDASKEARSSPNY